MFDKTSDIAPILVAVVLLIVIWRFYVFLQQNRPHIVTVHEVRKKKNNTNDASVKSDENSIENSTENKDNENELGVRLAESPDLVKIPPADRKSVV